MTERLTQSPTHRRNSQPRDKNAGENPVPAPTIVWMTAAGTTGFRRDFLMRVRQARETTGWNQRQMAEALGIPLKNYESYETRTLMPHHLIARFCLLAHISIHYLFTGRMKTRRNDHSNPSMMVQRTKQEG
jgi:ribosome-binding protein aMBF1 (putative translation factor)